MKRRYRIDENINPSDLPFVFDGDRVVTTIDRGIVEVDGLLPDGEEVPIPQYQSPSEVPQVVSRFQGEAILLMDGFLDDVEALVAQGDPMMQLAWKRAQEFRRTSPMVLQIAQTLNWTYEYLDDLFIRASAVEA